MQVEFLINLIRERPAVYDPSDPRHRDRDVEAAVEGGCCYTEVYR